MAKTKESDDLITADNKLTFQSKRLSTFNAIEVEIGKISLPIGCTCAELFKKQVDERS